MAARISRATWVVLRKASRWPRGRWPGEASDRLGPHVHPQELHTAHSCRQVKDTPDPLHRSANLAIVPEIDRSNVQLHSQVSEVPDVSTREVVRQHDVSTFL
jgi:hypothetical protein